MEEEERCFLVLSSCTYSPSSYSLSPSFDLGMCYFSFHYTQYTNLLSELDDHSIEWIYLAILKSPLPGAFCPIHCRFSHCSMILVLDRLFHGVVMIHWTLSIRSSCIGDSMMTMVIVMCDYTFRFVPKSWKSILRITHFFYCDSRWEEINKDNCCCSRGYNFIILKFIQCEYCRVWGLCTLQMNLWNHSLQHNVKQLLLLVSIQFCWRSILHSRGT